MRLNELAALRARFWFRLRVICFNQQVHLSDPLSPSYGMVYDALASGLSKKPDLFAIARIVVVTLT